MIKFCVIVIFELMAGKLQTCAVTAYVKTCQIKLLPHAPLLFMALFIIPFIIVLFVVCYDECHSEK